MKSFSITKLFSCTRITDLGRDRLEKSGRHRKSRIFQPCHPARIVLYSSRVSHVNTQTGDHKMPANQIAANNDVVGPIKLPNQNSTVVAQLELNGLTGANVKAQGRLSNAVIFTDIKMKDPATNTDIAALTTDGQMGWFENIGYNEVQFVQSGVTGGTGPADLFTNIGTDD